MRRGRAWLAAVLVAGSLLAGACTVEEESALSGPTTTAAPPTTAAPTGTDPACKDTPEGAETASLRPGPDALNITPGSFMAKIKARGKLIVGVSQDTYLFSYLDPETNRIVGFDVDIAKEVARELFGDPEKVELKAILYSERLPKLESEEVDLVADTMTITCRRWARISFSAEYYAAGQKILVRKDLATDGMTIEDLEDRKVCAATGSTSIDNIRKYPKVIAVDSPDWVTCLVWLQSGTVDAISTDDTILAGLGDQDPYVVVPEKTPVFSREPYGLGINKSHPEFVRYVNAVLEKLQAGRWQEIYKTNRLEPILGKGEQPVPLYRP